MTHFLFTAVPHSVYSADSTAVLGGVLKEMAQNLCSLFWDGVEVNSQRYHVALVGVKGDAEFHVEAAELLRSFYTVGTVNNLLMCPECHADDNFSDVSDRPVWLGSASTLHNCRVSFIGVERPPTNGFCGTCDFRCAVTMQMTTRVFAQEMVRD